MHGLTVEDPPRILKTYLFCCPALDGQFRCLPREGGYYDQDHTDMIGFAIIEGQIRDFRSREKQRTEHEAKMKGKNS